MKQSIKLKNLQAQLKKMTADYESLKIETANKQREVNQKKYQIDLLNKEIDKIKNNGVIKVSEHAILRYLERVSGLNVEAIEKLILNDNILEMINTLGGNGTYPSKEFKVIVKDNVITTIIV